MKIGMLKWVLLAILATILAGCAATEEGDEPDPSYDVLMASGKDALEEGDGYNAYILFTEADRLRSRDPEANLGIMISDLLQIVNLIDQIIYFGGEMALTDLPETEAVMRAKQWDDGPPMGAGDQIDVLLMQIFDERLEEMVTTGEIAKSDANINFTINSIPLNFQGEAILNLPGNWEKSDVLFFLAVSRLIQSGIDIFLSIDLNFDFGLVMDTMSTDFEVLETSQIIDLVVDLLYAMLTDEENSDFLLENDEAAVRMPKAGINLGTAAEEMLTAFEDLRHPDGPLGYVMEIDNGVHDPSEAYVIGDMAPFSDDLMLVMPELLDILDQVRISLYDGTEMDTDPLAPNYFDLAAFNPVLTQLGVPELISIPDYPVDLGGTFTNPEPEQFKETLTSLVGCLEDSGALIPTITCIIENL